MESTVSQSTFFLTILLGIGLFFFMKAATKDRTEVAEFVTNQSSDVLHKRLLDYFQNRAYKQVPAASTDSWITLTGLVRPSIFLAIFLTVLAAIALMCFALVLVTLFSSYGAVFFALVLLSPIAAITYWKGAQREEQIAFRLDNHGQGCRVSVRAHRDEIIQLKAQKLFEICP